MTESKLVPTFRDETRTRSATSFSDMGQRMYASFTGGNSMQAGFNQKTTSMHSQFSDNGGISISQAPDLDMRTAAEWALDHTYIPPRDAIVVVLDGIEARDEHNNIIHIPGLKIGDGLHVVSNLPYVTAE